MVYGLKHNVTSITVVDVHFHNTAVNV